MSPLTLGLAISGAIIGCVVVRLVNAAFRVAFDEAGDNAPYEIAESDWDLTVQDLEGAVRLHNDERDML